MNEKLNRMLVKNRNENEREIESDAREKAKQILVRIESKNEREFKVNDHEKSF